MSSLRLDRRLALVLVMAATTWLPTRAEAGPHRARLGSDLEQKLSRGEQSIDVIAHGTRAEVDALARRYNLRVRRHLKTGAVLGVTAGQLGRQ